MTVLGLICLSLALATTTSSIFAFALGISRTDDELVTTGRKGVYASTALLTLAVLVLIYALLGRDFQVQYVASYTSRDLSSVYSLSALWAGQQGSLLFWTWLLSLPASVVLLLDRRRQEPLLPYASLLIASIEAFFLIPLIFATNPFWRLDFIPTDGLGMNPLLQNPAVFWHGPVLYLGYIGFTVAFALTIGALISGRLEDRHLDRVRGWVLFSWLCLGMATLLGAQWVYIQPGWEGYWTWHPVEKASLMPWLMSTAVVHSLVIHQRRKTMKPWIMLLIIVTFALCVFGTFVTGGVATSIHASGVLSNMGSYFLGFVGFILVGSGLLLVKRLPELTGGREWGSLVSLQSSLVLAIILLVAATLAIFLGTLSPLVSRATTGSLASDYSDWTSGLILGFLVLLMGIFPFTHWRGSTARSAVRRLAAPFSSALVAAVLQILLGLTNAFAILAFAICAFALVSTLLAFLQRLGDDYRAWKENRVSTFLAMIQRQRSRYGGYVAHAGIIVVVIGATGSSAYKVEKQAMLERGASLTVGDYSLRYEDFSFYPAQGKDIATATLSIFRDERQVGVLVPQRHFHRNAQRPVTAAAIRTTLTEDLHVALISWEDTDSTITLQVRVSPLAAWRWIGAAVLVLGTAIAICPRPRKEVLEDRIEEEIMRLRQAGGGVPKVETLKCGK